MVDLEPKKIKVHFVTEFSGIPEVIEICDFLACVRSVDVNPLLHFMF